MWRRLRAGFARAMRAPDTRSSTRCYYGRTKQVPKADSIASAYYLLWLARMHSPGRDSMGHYVVCGGAGHPLMVRRGVSHLSGHRSPNSRTQCASKRRFFCSLNLAKWGPFRATSQPVSRTLGIPSSTGWLKLGQHLVYKNQQLALVQRKHSSQLIVNAL